MTRAGLDIKAIVSGALVFCLLLLLAFIVEGGLVHGMSRYETIPIVFLWIVHIVITLVRYGAASWIMLSGLQYRPYHHSTLLFGICFFVFAAFTTPLIRTGMSELASLYVIEAVFGAAACFGVALMKQKRFDAP